MSGDIVNAGMRHGDSPGGHRFRLQARHLVWLTVAALAAMGVMLAFGPIRVLPRSGLAPGFLLHDQDGASVTSEGLRGKVVLYTFSAVDCTGPCAETTRVMREVQDRLASSNSGIDVQLVTISIDPGRDTPDRLRAAAEMAGADPARWRFTVASDETATKQIVGTGFNVYYDVGPDGAYRLDPTFILVDGQGVIRAEYRVGLPEAQVIADDIGLVVNEAEQSVGAKRYVYEATHLLQCGEL